MRLRRMLMASVFALPLIFGLPAAAHADPVSTAILIGTGFTATAGAVAATTTFLINVGLFAATSLASKVMGKQKASVAERQASITTLSLGEVPRQAVIGMPCVGGSLVDVWNWGGQYETDNVTRCIALADHAVEDLYGYYVDDTFYPFTASGVQPGFNGTLTIDFRNATSDGHAPPSIAIAAGWEAADRMTAVTHAWVTTKYDEKVWTQGHPKFRWVMHGLRAFDPRNGDVWDDRSTHSITRNPALQRYAIARGIYAEGHQGEPEHLLIGRGLSADEAPPERIIAAANLCDEVVDGLSRYYADGVISADTDFIAVEEMFASAMAGVIVQREGGVEIEPGQAKAAVATITDGDLVVGEAVTFSRFLPDSDGGRINTVVPRYVEPAQNFADHSGPVRRDLADIARDGGPREMTLSLPLVTGGAVADRNAEIARRLARLERRATIVLPPQYAWLEEGDWIAWQSDRRHDGATIRYRIESWSLDEKWRMRLTLREIASSVYGVPDPIEDASLSPVPFTPPPPLVLPGVTAAPLGLEGEGDALPAIRFTWEAPVNPAIRAIRSEIRRAGETDIANSRTEAVGAGVWVVSDGVAPSSDLEARLIPIGEPGRAVTPGDWIALTTVALVALSPEESEALDRLQIIESDNWLSKGEKSEVLRQWEAVDGEYLGLLAALDAAGLTAARANYIDATSGLADYLNGLTPAWDDLNTDTAIIGTELRAAFKAYYVAKQAANVELSQDAAADASAAMARLDAIESDGVLSRNEKPEVIRQVTSLNDEYAGLSARGLAANQTAAVNAYATAVSGLNDYLATLTPAWNGITVDTPITGTAFRAAFNTAYVAKQALLNAIVGENTSASQVALAALDIIASDDWLSKGEKPELIRQYSVINSEYPALEAEANALGVTTQLTALANAIAALNSYLDGLSPAWNLLTVDTPVVGATLRSRVSACYTAKTALQSAFVGMVGADGAAALAQLNIIASDGWLSAGEKPALIQQYTVINGEYAGLSAQATALGTTTALTTLANAINALNSYLAGLSPAWDSLTVDTPVVGATLRGKFADCYTAKTALQNALVGEVGADAGAALAQLNIISSDSWLSRGEKPGVKLTVDGFNADYPALAAQASTLGIGAPLTSFADAVNALNTYLAGLSPTWSDAATDTPIVAATFQSRFAAVYSARETLRNAMFAAQDADLATVESRILVITSDDWLSANEKPELVRQASTLNGDLAGLTARASSLGLSSTYATHAATITTLNNYLGGLTPGWSVLTVDTPITGATLRGYLLAAYSTKQALLNAFTASLDATTQATLSDLAVIASDNWLSRSEKPLAIREYTTLNADYPGLAAQASSLGVSTALSAHAAAITAMNAYLDSLSPGWSNLSVDTPVDGPTFRNKFNDAYVTRSALTIAIAAAINADAQAALSAITIISSDNWLSKGEKSEVVRQYSVINSEYPGLAERAVAVGATAQLSAYGNAIVNMNNYLGALSPAFDNSAFDTPIYGPTFRSYMEAPYTTKQALINAITAASGGGSALTASLSTDIVYGVRSGAGYVSTPYVSLTIGGSAAGSASVRWVKTEVNVPNDIALIGGSTSVAFGGTIPAGDMRRAIYLAIVTAAGGHSVTLSVDVQLVDNT